mgnify:CR=1 FL=1
MPRPIPPRRLARSLLSLFAGFVVVVVLSLGTDAAMHAAGIFPALGQVMNDSLFALALAYRNIYGIVGGYVTARLAPDRPLRHCILSGMIGLVITAFGAVVTWDQGPEFGPHWYSLALMATALPDAWAGARLFGKD